MRTLPDTPAHVQKWKSNLTYKNLIAVAKSARHVELNYKDWKDMLVS